MNHDQVDGDQWSKYTKHSEAVDINDDEELWITCAKSALSLLAPEIVARNCRSGPTFEIS